MRESNVNGLRLQLPNPTRTNSVKKDRDFTDCFFTFICGIVCISWIGVVIRAFVIENTSDVNDGRSNYSDTSYELDDRLANYFVVKFLANTTQELIDGFYNGGYSYLFIACGIVLTITATLSFLILLRYCPKFSYFVGILCLPLVSIKLVLQFYYEPPLEVDPETYISPIYNTMDSTTACLSIYIAKMIFCLVGLICMVKIGAANIADAFREIINAFFSFAYLMLFGLILLLFQIVIVFLTIASFYSPSTNETSRHVVVFGGFYICCTAYYFGKMVISPTIASWFRTQNKTDITKSLLLEQIHDVVRHHFGTAAFVAMPIIPFCVALAVFFKHKFYKKFVSSPSNFILILYLMWNSADYSSTMASLNGKNFYYSTRDALRLLTKKSSLSLAIIYIFYATILAGGLIVALMAKIPSFVWNQEILSFEPAIYAAVWMVPIYLMLDLFGQVYVICTSEYNGNTDLIQENMGQLSPTNHL